ncbi:transporter [Aureibaculum conchae]|uniref:transporter n=1 Tax=Aureibaculum sp. 2308TA14-22 TaxID=3108392 RepID=UPI00339221F8
MKFRVSVPIFFVIITTSVIGQTCCSGGIPLSNNLGLEMLGKGTFQIGLNYDYNNLNTLKSGSTTLDDSSRLRITHTGLLNLGFSITNNLAIESLFTWVNQRRKISQFGNENLDQSSGVGDAILLVKYRFNNVFGKTSSLNFGVGAKLPLGSSTEKNNQGVTLNADLQPGSNTFDMIYWTMVSKNFDFRPSLTVSSRFIYRSAGTNNNYFGDSSYKFGNDFQTYLSFSDQFIISKKLVSPAISFKYRNASKDKIEEFNLNNTGGNWVSIIPGFSVDINSKIAFLTKAEIPIYSNVDGTQLTPTFRLTSGILIKITRKTRFLNLN